MERLGVRAQNTRLELSTWALSLGICSLRPFALELLLGTLRQENVCLGSFTWERALGFFIWELCLRCFTWDLSLWLFAWNFLVGSFAFELSINTFRLRCGKREFGHVRLETFALKAWLGNFMLDTVALNSSLRTFAW